MAHPKIGIWGTFWITRIYPNLALKQLAKYFNCSLGKFIKYKASNGREVTMLATSILPN